MFVDPHTSKQLAEFAIREFLEQAEKDRLARQVSRRNGRRFSRLGTFTLNWVRRVKAPAPKPLHRPSAETH